MTASIAELVTKRRCSRRWLTSPAMPPPGELDARYASSLILARSFHYLVCENLIYNDRKYITYFTAVRRGLLSHRYR